MKTKKRKLKTWVLYLLYTIFIFLLLYILYSYNLITTYNNYIDITKAIILIILYELTRKTTKELYKRIIQKMEG